MSISFIAIDSYILKSVAPWGQNTLRGALYPTLPYSYVYCTGYLCLLHHTLIFLQQSLVFVILLCKVYNNSIIRATFF